MKERFHFGLERVRQVRAHAEDRAKEELAASVAQRERGAELLRSAEARLREAQSAGTELAAAPVAAHELHRRQAWLERLERTRIVAALGLDRADAEVDARRNVLTGASRERQVLDKLRDRQAEAHALELARHQATILDEVALQGHLRKGSA